MHRLRLILSLLLTSVAAQAEPVSFVGLTEDNRLVLFTAARPGETQSVRVTDVSGTLVGIDYRPANGRLYGVTDTNNVYTLDSASGAAVEVSTLTVAFDGGPQSGMDFNPQSDRLRLVGSNGRNVRGHADLGAAAIDSALAYIPADLHFGAKPTITAAAYTDSLPNTLVTKLFAIDAALDVLVLQDPPNDGTLTTIGPLGVDFGPLGGFDIVSSQNPQKDEAFAASGATLYSIDLTTGKATALGTIGQGDVNIIGLAARAQ